MAQPEPLVVLLGIGAVAATIVMAVRYNKNMAAQHSDPDPRPASTLRPCKDCGKDISPSARACPHCGAPTKPRTTIATYAVTILAVLFIWGWLFVKMEEVEKDAAVRASASVPRPPESAYPPQANLDYRAAALGQLPHGTLLTFTGKVLQRIGSDARLATKRQEYLGYSGDDVYLTFESPPPVLDDDVLRVRGRYEGTLTYETVLRTERVIPRIRVDYFDVVKAR